MSVSATARNLVKHVKTKRKQNSPNEDEEDEEEEFLPLKLTFSKFGPLVSPISKTGLDFIVLF